MIEVTDEMFEAYGRAVWSTPHQSTDAETTRVRRRAGLAAALAIVERDYLAPATVPAQAEPAFPAADLLRRAAESGFRLTAAGRQALVHPAPEGLAQIEQALAQGVTFDQLATEEWDGEPLFASSEEKPAPQPLPLAIGRVQSYCGRLERPHAGHVWTTQPGRWCPGDEVPGRPEPTVVRSAPKPTFRDELNTILARYDDQWLADTDCDVESVRQYAAYVRRAAADPDWPGLSAADREKNLAQAGEMEAFADRASFGAASNPGDAR